MESFGYKNIPNSVVKKSLKSITGILKRNIDQTGVEAYK